jgi:autoinducer 2 (AI-2) kinase
VFDPDGRPLASAQEPFTYRFFADPDMPMIRGFDLDPTAFWGVLARCARAALAQLPTSARVRGVIATSQREGCVFLDRAGEVLYAGPNLDARGVAEAMEVQGVYPNDALHAITGHAPPYIFPLVRFLWFRKRHDAGRVASLLMLNDWITYLLSGERGAEHSNAGESLLYDVSRRDWSPAILDAFDVPRDILPPIRPTGAEIGRVTATAAAATGIPAGTPVFVGGADTESALLGSGAHDAGQTGAVLGTTSPVQMVMPAPLLDPAANLWTSCHVVGDRWVLESNGGDTGSSFRWLLELMFGASDAAAHAKADAEALAVGFEGRPVFTHLGPAIFNLHDMNPFRAAGVLFRFPILHVDRPTRGEIVHAFLENVAYAIRANCEQVEAVSGQTVGMLRVSGGMTQSRVLPQLLADTLGVPLAVSTVPESACLGSAVLAAVGAGFHPDVASAVVAMTRVLQVDPVAARVPACDDRYRKWREIYATLRTVSL